jgi:hypothetical protein
VITRVGWVARNICNKIEESFQFSPIPHVISEVSVVQCSYDIFKIVLLSGQLSFSLVFTHFRNF